MLTESLFSLYNMYLDEFQRKYNVICTSWNADETTYIATFNEYYQFYIEEIIYDIECGLLCTIEWFDISIEYGDMMTLHEYATIKLN